MLRTIKSLIFLIEACLIFGVYGIIHSQLIYSIDPVYFLLHVSNYDKNPSGFQDRLNVALIGFQGAWWIGLVAGGPIMIAENFIYKDFNFSLCVFNSLFVALLTVMIFGFYGWLSVCLSTDNTCTHVQYIVEYGEFGIGAGAIVAVLYLVWISLYKKPDVTKEC